VMGDITLGQYYPGDSPLHKADPRVKILMSLALMIIVFVIDNLLCLSFALVFSVFAVMVSKVPLSYAFKGLKPVLIIILFTMVLNVFFSEGTPLFTVWKFTVTYEGLMRAVRTALRITVLITGSSLVTLTTTPIMLTDAIEKLLNPLKKIKVPVHEIAMMMSIALRFIPVLMEETQKIIKAQTARGADFDTGNLFQKAKSFIPVLVPLFISAFRRADDLATAMEARCYRGGENRTRLKQLKMTKMDLYVSFVFVSVMLLIMLADFFL
jgi:energy-coupling factor transport system permease protein